MSLIPSTAFPALELFSLKIKKKGFLFCFYLNYRLFAIVHVCIFLCNFPAPIPTFPFFLGNLSHTAASLPLGPQTLVESWAPQGYPSQATPAHPHSPEKTCPSLPDLKLEIQTQEVG